MDKVVFKDEDFEREERRGIDRASEKAIVGYIRRLLYKRKKKGKKGE